MARYAFVLTAAFFLSLSWGQGTANAACCYVDDPGELTCILSPIQSDEELGAVCGQSVRGNNCVLQIKADVSGTNNTDCLELDGAVTLEMEGHTFDCPDAEAPCGIAIDTTGGGVETIGDGAITGCWDEGINAHSNGVVNDMTIDLGGASCQGGRGIIAKKINRSVVANADKGMETSLNSTFADVLVRDCDLGISFHCTGLLDRAVLLGNDTHIGHQCAGSTLKGDLKTASLQNATDCNCGSTSTPSTCIDIEDCVALKGATTFVDDQIFD